MRGLFYPSKVYKGRKDKLYLPESITDRIMLNPVYKMKNIMGTPLCICDSGAFQDIDKETRLTPMNALLRQVRYRDMIAKEKDGFNFEAFCIYDQMIGVDECIIDGKKVKLRGTEDTAKQAIQDTLGSAQVYYKYRDEYNVDKVVWISQGVTPKQYLQECTIPLLDYFRDDDYYGFGGFCIIGRMRKIMLPLFYETVSLVLPALKSRNIKRVHVLGVCIPEAIKHIVHESRKYSITVSTDSSAPEINALAFGKSYNNEMRATIYNGIKNIDYDPIDLAHNNVRSYATWMKQL